MLGRKINRTQWIALLVLFVGVATVQVQNATAKQPSEDQVWISISGQDRNSLIFRVQLLVLEALLLHVCFLDLLVSTLKKFWKDQQHQFGSEMFNSVYSVQFWLLLVLIWKKVQSSQKKDFSSGTIILSGLLLQIKHVEDFWLQWLSSTPIISWKEHDHSRIFSTGTIFLVQNWIPDNSISRLPNCIFGPVSN